MYQEGLNINTQNFKKELECLKLINFSSTLGLTTVKQANCNENSVHKIHVIFGRILLSRISGIRILLLDQPDHKLVWNPHHISLSMFPTKGKKTQRDTKKSYTKTNCYIWLKFQGWHFVMSFFFK